MWRISDFSRSELADSLPIVEEPPTLVDEAPGFLYVDTPDEAYVAPRLRRSSGGAAMPSLVLVEARAAVGKSMLARNLAWATRGILWDLSSTHVGNGTIWGSLAKAFGLTELNNIVGRTATGQLVIIVDALDEAEMQAEGPFFDAFLTDLRDMFAAARPLPGAVLLGRTETIDYVELFLSESVPMARYEILDFDRSLAYEFVDKRLDAGRISSPEFIAGSHHRHEKLYESALERLFDFLIERLMPDHERADEDRPGHEWPVRVASFLGYAPVLEAVAEFLASYASNFPALIADLTHMADNPYHSGNAQWNMLRNIVNGLLRREQAKVVAQLRLTIPETADCDWTEVYHPDEQCTRVLGRISGSVALRDIGANVPDEFSARYQEVLKNALPNHPFLGGFFGYANVVFRDFVHAWGLRSQSRPVMDAIRAELRSEDYLASPLLGPFMLAAQDSPALLPSVAGEDLGFIYESLLTQGDSHLYVYAEDDEAASVYVGSDPATATAVAVFSVRDRGAPIVFWRRLIHAQINGDLVVRLGHPDRSFSLGPGVSIDCVMLEAPSRAIRVFTSGPDGRVNLHASVGYDGGPVEPTLAKFGPGTLAVSWEGLRYPWAEYAAQPDPEEQFRNAWNDVLLQESFTILCRIARRFATSTGNRPSRWGPVPVNNPILRVKSGGPQSNVFSWLLDNRIIYKEHQYYFMDSRELLDRFRVRLFELCVRAETHQTLALIQRYALDTEAIGERNG